MKQDSSTSRKKGKQKGKQMQGERDTYKREKETGQQLRDTKPPQPLLRNEQLLLLSSQLVDPHTRPFNHHSAGHRQHFFLLFQHKLYLYIFVCILFTLWRINQAKYDNRLQMLWGNGNE